MGVKMLLFAKCKFRDSVLQNGPRKHPKVSWAKFFSIDFHYTWIEVTPDISINFKLIRQ